jgi:hypothetical protein
MLGANMGLDIFNTLTLFLHLDGRGFLSIYGCRAGESIVTVGAFVFATFCALDLRLGSTGCWKMLFV